MLAKVNKNNKKGRIGSCYPECVFWLLGFLIVCFDLFLVLIFVCSFFVKHVKSGRTQKGITVAS